MPRTKAKAVQRNGDLVSSKDTNGAAVLDDNPSIAVMPEAKVKASKKSASVGRGKKKPETVNSEVEDAVTIEKKDSIKGRSKTVSEKEEKSVEIVPVYVEPTKPKGRNARKAAVNYAEISVENGEDVTAVKSTARGRRKKEASPMPVSQEKIPNKRVSKKTETISHKIETLVDAEVSDVTMKRKSSKMTPTVEKVTEGIALSKAGTKRSKVKKTDKMTALIGEEPEIVAENAASPKKKLKVNDAVDKVKPEKQLKNKSSKTKTEPKQEPEFKLDSEPKPKKEIKEKNGHDKAAVTDAKKSRGRKRAAAATENNEIEEEDEIDGAKPAKTKKATPLNATDTSYNKADFTLSASLGKTGISDDKTDYNLKISSWNVAGLRSWLKKDGLKYLEYEEPDIFCMQEIKCTTDQLPDEAARIPGYHPYWLCMPGGYAGVAIYSKIMPIHVEYGIGNAEFDDAGRIITAEYEKFFLINVYVPNSGRKLVNLEPRMHWEKLFQNYVQKLDARKPVIICGDMNVSHQEIDLANPKTNTRNAGFTKEERDKMSELLALGYVDTFRHLYPERKGAYTFWTYMGNARARNVGWRLDYFLVSERLLKRVVENCMRVQCKGSDHCPITLYMNM